MKWQREKPTRGPEDDGDKPQKVVIVEFKPPFMAVLVFTLYFWISTAMVAFVVLSLWFLTMGALI